MRIIESQKELIHEEEWDYLLLLDACRYDEFRDMFNKYLKGDLSKVESEGSQTLEWMYKTFPDEYDISYVSGHPFVNSKGITRDCALRRGVEARGGNADYVPAEHFKKIIDVWDWGADNKWGTVTPDQINKSLRENEFEKQVIAHYVTPHFPWLIGYRSGDPVDKVEKLFPKSIDSGSLGSSEIHKIGGEELLRKAYRYNLSVVLSEVETIVLELEGNIIITSDHGNLFQPNAHFPMSDEPGLRHVPWLVIE